MTGALAMIVYLGCYTGVEHSDGLFAIEFDPASGKMESVASYPVKNAIYLAYSPDRKWLYSCEGTGLVAFAVQDGGKLVETDRLDLGMHCVCHLSVSADGSRVFFAEYIAGKAGSVAVKDGKFSTPVVHVHSGSGPNLPRQGSAHCHQAVPSPDGGGYVVVDLGLDELVEYRFAADGSDPGGAAARRFRTTLPGAGPRHLVFHPEGRLAFLVSELYSKLDALAYDPAHGFTATLDAASSRSRSLISTRSPESFPSGRAPSSPAAGRATSSSSPTRWRWRRWSAPARCMRSSTIPRPAGSPSCPRWAASTAPSRF